MNRSTPLQNVQHTLRERSVLLFFLWSLWLSFEYFAFGPSSAVWLFDNADGNLPAHLIMSGRPWEFWSPAAGCGFDRLSLSFTGELDYFLFSVFPGWLAYGVITWLQRFVAGYFTFRLLRDQIAIPFLPALFAGLSYALFSQISINYQWAGFTLYDGLALPGFPLILWVLGRLNPKEGGRSYACAALLGFTLALTSLYAFVIFLIPAVVFWFVFVTPRREPSFWVMTGLFGVAWFVGEIPSLWAGMLNAPLSHRAAWKVNSLATAPLGALLPEISYTLYLFIRDNALAFALALAGFFFSNNRDRRHIVVFSAAGICLAFIVFHKLFSGILLERLGWLSSFHLHRLCLLIPFLSVAAAALGLALVDENYRVSLLKGPSRAVGGIGLRRLLALAAIGLVVGQSASVKVDMFRQMAQGANFASLFENRDLRKLSDVRDGNAPFRVATIASIRDQGERLHPAFAMVYGLETADGYLGIYPKRYHDYWEQLIAPLLSKAPELFERFHYWGSRIYLFAPTEDLACGREIRFGELYSLPLLSLANVRYVLSSQLLLDDDLELLPSDVRNVQLEWEKKPLRTRFYGLIAGNNTGRPVYIYENRKAMPRFFVTDRIRGFTGPEELLTALRQATHEDLLQAVYMQAEDLGRLPTGFAGKGPSKSGAGSVTVGDYAPDRICITAEARGPGVLVITNTFSPFWKARVDGVAREVFPVYHTFQGIFLEGGRHEITLEYLPPYAVKSSGL